MKKKELRALAHPELCWAGMAGDVIRAARTHTPRLDEAHAMATALQGLGLPAEPAEVVMSWMIHCWERQGKPLFWMDETLAWSLAYTEPPMTTFELMPRLPINGMFISLPPVFQIENDQTGMHRVEGLYITENDVLVPKDRNADFPRGIITGEESAAHFDVVRGITVMGVGEDKGPNLKKRLASGMGWFRDDALIFFHLVPGRPIHQSVAGEDYALGGTAQLTRVVVNLLYLLQNTREITTTVEDPRPELRKEDRGSRREREREEKKGRSVLPCTVLRLSSLERPLPPHRAEGGMPPAQKIRGFIVLGHIHHYWVRSPQDAPVLASRVNPHGTEVHKIAKWLLPYTKGTGPVPEKNVRIT